MPQDPIIPSLLHLNHGLRNFNCMSKALSYYIEYIFQSQILLTTHDFNKYHSFYVQKDQLNTISIEPVAPLLAQRKLAILTSLVAIIFVTLAIMVSYSKKHFIYKFALYTILSMIGSLFLAMGTIFTSNSFGVYI